ncbi:mechanosensitive ion channel family protein [Halostella sp. JP-L12]|uniref:mechanosensitive ion channel family protein n=1 Tax=Halostella TaxID=1843185 RepID=UPI000EF7B559|nr:MULTISPECIES: mechanosensitive ion channel family protein [Halostella]NHN48999.1 mechanosensitive ion channel family protein [Halostella sp. JP-L12]
MASVVQTVNELSNVFQSLGARTAVTLLCLLFVVTTASLSRYTKGVLTKWIKPIYADALTTLGFVVGFVAAALVSVGVWGQADLVGEVFARLNVSSNAVPNAAFTLVVLVGTHILVRFAKGLLSELQDSSHAVSEHQREITLRLTQVVLWSLGIIVVLGVWNFNLSGLLVGAGFLGIIVGMAARQTLGSMLAGFVLMFARPFEIGDWVEIGDEEGIVTDITIVNTRIQTFNGEYVMIPNDVVSGNTIINRTRKGRLRIEVDVGVDYDADVERASEVAKAAMGEVDDILTVPTPQVVVKEFDDSSVLLGLRFWIDNPSARRKWRARTSVIQAVKTAFEDEGIKIPFPQRELTGREETGGFRMAERREATATAPDGGEE